MKLITTIALSSLLLLVSASSTASAGTIIYNVTINGAQAGTASTATGSAVVIVDDVADTVSVSLSFTGLIGGNASAAHIHCCVAIPGNAAVVIPFTGFPSAASGMYSNTFTGVSSTIIAGIEAYQAYINIHDSVYPGGEIRGNIIPEPASLGLMGLGVLGMIVALKARRKA